jgi:hypothetical protein
MEEINKEEIKLQWKVIEWQEIGVVISEFLLWLAEDRFFLTG